MVTVLYTGATGGLGRCFVEELLCLDAADAKQVPKYVFKAPLGNYYWVLYE